VADFFRRARRLAAATALLAAAGPAFGLEADLIAPEVGTPSRQIELSAGAEKQAECLGMFLQATLEEETGGPDRALPTKRALLALDPGFTDLAMDVAHQQLRRGDVPEAISTLKDAAKAAPKRVEPPVALAGIYLRQLAKPDFAEKFAAQALASCPDDPAPYQIFYEIYKAARDDAKIAALFAKALKRASPPPDFWLDIADLRLREPLGRDAGSLDALLERAQAAAADRPESLARVGDYFLLANRPDRAIPLFELALNLRPSLPGARQRLASAHLQAGNPEAAVRVLEEIIADDPINLRAYDLLAELYLGSGDYKRALANMRQALVIAPPDPARYDRVIRLDLALDDPDAALAAAEDAQKLFPRVPNFQLARALALGRLNRHGEAVAAFEQVLAVAETARPQLLDADFYFAYGVSSEQLGHLEKAVGLFKKSIACDPSKSARACNYLGYMWADRGENLPEAEQLIRRALADEPANGAFLDSLGWVLFRQGRHADALRELLRANDLLRETPDPVVLEHVGDTYDALGQPAEAVTHWQRALALDPDNAALVSKIDARTRPVANSPAR
jgi:tetratricopeptide (TPR) repeat protein